MISPLDSSAVVSLLALRRKAWVGGLVITAATLILLVATEPRLAIVWDEGFILGREERVRLWFRAVRDPAAFAAAWVPPSLLIELIEPDSRPPPVASEINTRETLRPVCTRMVLAVLPRGAIRSSAFLGADRPCRRRAGADMGRSPPAPGSVQCLSSA